MTKPAFVPREVLFSVEKYDGTKVSIRPSEKPFATTVEDIRDALHTEKIRTESTWDLAHDMQRDLSRYFGATKLRLEPRFLSPEIFNVLYDPSLPTIAIDRDHTFSGSELLGLAACESETRANIIYIQTETDNVLIKTDTKTDKSNLEASSGVMILPDGQVAYGEFPHPVPVDSLESADIALVEQCEKLGVQTFHTSDSMRLYKDKGELEKLNRHVYSYTPPRLTYSAFMASESVDNLVIKPSKHSNGRGVLLTDTNADIEHTKRFYHYLLDNNYEPIVEERARSFEIRNPETGERLDWNVRAIMSYGELIDMYVRADNWGGPVNMSVSADAISMDDFPSYFAEPEQARAVISRLRLAAQAIARENPLSFIGADMTVDEQKRVCLFELNCGYVGGMQTIAKLDDTYDGKLAAARKILKKFAQQTTIDRSDPTNPNFIESYLEPSFTSLAFAARNSSQRATLEKLDLSEIPSDDHERVGAVMAMSAIRREAYFRLDFANVQNIIDERLLSDYPLETRHIFPMIYLTSNDRKKWIDYIDQYSELFPDDTEILAFRADLAAKDFDIKQYKQVYERAVSRPDEDGNNLYRKSLNGFLQRFGTVFSGPRNVTLEHGFAFTLLPGVLAAYCEHGYDTANRFIERELELVGTRNDQSRLVRSLQFCMAVGDERYDEALRIYRLCKQEFEGYEYKLEENISEQYILSSHEDILRSSDDMNEFRIKLAYLSDNQVSATIDMIDVFMSHDASRQSQERIMRVIADELPLEATAEEREKLYEVLMDVVTGDSGPFPIPQLVDDLSKLSDMTLMTHLIDAIFKFDLIRSTVFLDELKKRESLINVDYIQDTYIGDYLNWSKKVRDFYKL